MFGRRKPSRHRTRNARPTGDEVDPFESQRAPDDSGDSEFGSESRPNGPFDAAEVDLDEARKSRIDLGGLLVTSAPGIQVQIQLDQRTKKGTSVLLRLGEAAVQLIAIAAPRTTGRWEQTRLELIANTKSRGGSAEEASGPFGTEVRAIVPATTADGKQARQVSRVSGIDGPRWMLRATFLGKAISDAAAYQQLVDVVRSVVVIRGDQPMPPGDIITLEAPTGSESQTRPTSS